MELGRQISLLLTNEDLKTVDELLRLRGDVAAFSITPNETHDALVPLSNLMLEQNNVAHSSVFCLLAPKGDDWRLVIEKHSEIKYRANVGLSDLIDFWRPFCDGQVIRRGRLYYTTNTYENGASHDKSPQFCKWAGSILSAVRRSLKRDARLSAYVGKDAAQRIASGELTVVP